MLRTALPMTQACAGLQPVRVSDGTRTRDRLDHNQELYQLSYAHHAAARSGDDGNPSLGRAA